MAQSTSPTSTRNTSRPLTITAGVTLALIAVQFALAGYGTFERQYHKADDGWFEPHQAVGYTIALLTLVLLLVAVFTHQGRGTIVRASVLAILAVPLQPLLGQLGTDTNPWFGVLHALSGVAIAALTGMIFGPSL